MASILFIDDSESTLTHLTNAVKELLSDDQVKVRSWAPKAEDGDPSRKFASLVDPSTKLVVTDLDLTSRGQTGLFGHTIVEWCQNIPVPVADYSRKNLGELPAPPELFELPVTDPNRAAQFIVSLFDGFRAIERRIGSDPSLLQARSPAGVLASILDRPEAETHFAPYVGHLAAAGGAVARLAHGHDRSAETINKESVLGYLIGHLLYNGILRYPGPILSAAALNSYVAGDVVGNVEAVSLFDEARYTGPFSSYDSYWWLEEVEGVLQALGVDRDSGETMGEVHRAAIERKIQQPLARHDCTRCRGVNGGYYCPLTNRTVCLKGDCSVGANSFIPSGATLCRIERTFFDEWAPIVGF